MIIPLKYKYRCHKPSKMNKAQGGHSGQSRHKVAGPKTYDRTKHVMIVNALTGHKVMQHL